MKKIIRPTRPQETDTTIDFQLAKAKCSKIFIVSKETNEIIGMCVHDMDKNTWKASTGIGGLVGSHKTIEELIYQIPADKYDLVINPKI